MSIKVQAFLAIGLVSFALAGGLPAAAQRGTKKVPQLTQRAPIQIFPKRAARIDRNGHIVGKWVELTPPQQGIQDAPPWYVAFDCFEEDPVTLALTNNLYGATYSFGGGGPNSRIYFGDPYLAPYVANDMTVAKGWAGLPLNRFRSGFTWGGAATGSEHCFLVVGTFDTFGFTVAGTGPNTADSDFLTGVVLDFGTLNYVANSFYTFDTGALPAELSLKMPSSGTGGYEIVMANQVTPTLTLASHSQLMLWCTKPLNPSFQGLVQWYDDTDPVTFTNTPNGVLQTNPPNTGTAVEWNDFTYPTVFPVPLGTLAGFYCDTQPLDSYDITGGYLAGPPADYPVSNLFASDDTYVDIIGDPTSPAPQIVVHHTTTYTNSGPGALDQATSKIDIVTETRSSRLDMVERLQGYDWTLNGGAGNWSGGGSGGQFNHPPFASDTSHTDTITLTPARYVNPTTREIKVRYTWIPASDVAASDGWLASMDRCSIIPTR